MRPTTFFYGVHGAPAYVPPAPRRGQRFGASTACWLCGGPTAGVGWPRVTALPDTFTNHNLAASPASDAICQACMFCQSKATWETYVDAHPAMGLKKGHAMSWRFYSHAAWGTMHHECPQRARWRALLLDPPAAPFLYVIAVSGQKHLIFRGTVASDRDRFPVLLEETTVWVDRARWRACLDAVETLYALGFAKEGILTGRYHQATMRTVGLARWRAAERALAPWRRRPRDLDLALHVAQRPAREAAA